MTRPTLPILEAEFPNLAKVFNYWTWEEDPEFHHVASCFEAMIALVIWHDLVGGHDKLPVTLHGLIEAAEAIALRAGPGLDLWAHQRQESEDREIEAARESWDKLADDDA